MAAPRGRSSVGRASPCQGEGRQFESGRPLHENRPGPSLGGLRFSVRGMRYYEIVTIVGGREDNCLEAIYGLG